MSKSDDVTIAAFLLGMIAVPAFALLLIPVMLLRAWALRLLWGWFIVPTFGLPLLTYPQAIGISLIVGFYHHSNSIKSEYKDPAWQSCIVGIVGTFLSVGIGWIVQRWM